jgi:peptidase M48-like protein
MRVRSLLTGSVILYAAFAAPASSQTSQAGWTWESGRGLAIRLEPFVRHVEQQDGRFEDLGYVQRVEDRVAAAAGVSPYEIRVTFGFPWYGFLLPQRVLYVSVGLLGRVSSEAELVGLLAHELAHAQSRHPVERLEQCVLATGYLPVKRNGRIPEQLATGRGLAHMKAAGYDPSTLLDLFSKIAYEHPPWSKAIVAEDLLSLRVALEAEAEPVGGYSIDSSEFAKFHARLPADPARSAPTIRVAPDLRRPADQ